MRKIMERLFREEEGQGLVEYGLILGLVAVAVIAGLTLMGGNLKGLFDEIGEKIPDSIPDE